MSATTGQRIIIGNALEVLKTLEAESIDVCVTSPPYWGLRDYRTEPVKWDDGWVGQLGLEPEPLDYIEHLCSIFDEVKRVLKPTGACWVNIADSYSTNAGQPYTSDYITSKKHVDAKPKLKRTNLVREKSLVLIPSRFAIEMTERGWILRNECIWHKPNVMPVSIKDRFTVDYEKFFFFTKNPKYYFKQQFEQTSHAVEDKTIGMGGRNKRTTWSILTSRSPEAHVAMFPMSLIKTPIMACCPDGGTVLDPFCGSGTVLEYCRKHDLNGIGIEINPEFKTIIDRRMMANVTKLDAFEVSNGVIEEVI